MVAFQDDLKGCHTGNTAQAVVNLFVKIDAQLIGEGLPSLIMILVGKADNAIQVEYDSFLFIGTSPLHNIPINT